MQPSWMLLVIIAMATANPITVTSKNISKGDKNLFVQKFFKATFFQAAMFCANIGMELVSCNNQREFDEVNEYLIKTVPRDELIEYWSAGVKIEPMKFGWMNTGLPVDLPGMWGPGEPNNIGNEECLEFSVKGKTGRLYMNDANCSVRNYFICQNKV
ncbi:PREDICTED: E-selectin-like [Nicrophorus vespilloides]|uniref:E-selectin-like n=1 Tax=Nicrophorus vespilloides TaxID=110193 RepID=A0ABM1MBZ1_NICVS|nr:PREDICTED: E-selectin-like [Nicrophorus vespilloides]